MARRGITRANFGFGGGYDKQRRIILPSGRFNIHKRGMPFWERFRLFHAMVRLPWGLFFMTLIGFYTLLNLLFAAGYVAIGVEQLTLDPPTDALDRFLQAFFFSTQTFTSVGFGRVSPVGLQANFLASLEAFVGLMSLALATGLLYGKFSRPVPKLLFSQNVLLTKVQGKPAMVFRFANRFSHHLIEARVTVLASFAAPGSEHRSFTRLQLEYDTVQFLTLNWTVVHIIDEESPFYGITRQQMTDGNAELLVTVNAFDDNHAQHVYEVKGYYHTHFVETAKPFAPMFYTDEDNGHIILELDKIDHVQA